MCQVICKCRTLSRSARLSISGTPGCTSQRSALYYNKLRLIYLVTFKSLPMNPSENTDLVGYIVLQFYCPALKSAQINDTHCLHDSITEAVLCLLAYPLCQKHPIVFFPTARQPLGTGKLYALKASLCLLTDSQQHVLYSISCSF